MIQSNHRNASLVHSHIAGALLVIFSSAIRMFFSPHPECAPRAVFENIIQIQCKNEGKHRMTIAMRLSNRTTYITKYHPTLTAHNKSLQQQLQASAESVKEGALP